MKEAGTPRIIEATKRGLDWQLGNSEDSLSFCTAGRAQAPLQTQGHCWGRRRPFAAIRHPSSLRERLRTLLPLIPNNGNERILFCNLHFQLIILGGLLSSSDRFRFPSRPHAANNQVRRTRHLQPTVKCVLTGGLSQGVQSKIRFAQLGNFPVAVRTTLF